MEPNQAKPKFRVIQGNKGENPDSHVPKIPQTGADDKKRPEQASSRPVSGQDSPVKKPTDLPEQTDVAHRPEEPQFESQRSPQTEEHHHKKTGT